METLPRTVAEHNAETLLLLAGLLLIAAARAFHAGKFQYFLRVFFSDKYLKLYRKEQSLHYNWFHLFLFGVQLISFGLFVKLMADYFNLFSEVSIYIVVLAVGAFILGKFMLERAVSLFFNLRKFFNYYNFYKLSYRNFTGMVLLPFNALLIYNPGYNDTMIYATLIFFALLNLATVVLTIKNNQKGILLKPFYFILYLCTLEIAPYLILARTLVVA